MSGQVPRAGGEFQTTHWSVIAAARDGGEEDARKALAFLCEQYWLPLYTFVRRRGHREQEAQDLTQDFFERFLRKGYFRQADRERGRFRSYLLACMKHFLANEWDRERAQRRGGDRVKLSLDFDRAESLFAELAAREDSPDAAYDREWAQTMLAGALHDLEAEYTAAGKEKVFLALKPVLRDGASSSYREVGERLGLSEGAVKVAAHRLRKRYGALLRTRIAETLDTDDTVDEELRYLLSLH